MWSYTGGSFWRQIAKQIDKVYLTVSNFQHVQLDFHRYYYTIIVCGVFLIHFAMPADSKVLCQVMCRNSSVKLLTHPYVIPMTICVLFFFLLSKKVNISIYHEMLQCKKISMYRFFNILILWKKTTAYGFGMTWEWANKGRLFIFGQTVPVSIG